MAARLLGQVSGYLQYHALDQALSELCTSTLQSSQQIGSLSQKTLCFVVFFYLYLG